jgi:CheY-like chemotaxis protein
VAYGLGPRARRVYAALYERIVRGEWPVGTRLPPHLDLAAELGVAPMTIRQVLGRLEDEGLVSRQLGRGTFVLAPAGRAVLIVDGDGSAVLPLADYIAGAGYRSLTASGPIAGLAALSADPTVALVLAAVRQPTVDEGIAFIRAVRRRWTELPLAAMIAVADDLAALYGAPEWPVLVIPKPIRLSHVDEVLQLALGRPAAAVGPSAAGADDPSPNR